MTERAFIVVRHGAQRWQVVTEFLRVAPGWQTMKAARATGDASGLTRLKANALATALNTWLDKLNHPDARRNRRA